jgi:hypothetical protein
MRYKATFAVGFGLGYVLGSKAGRQRYEQLSRVAHNLAESPAVQSAAGVLQAQGARLVGQARSKVTETVTSAMGGQEVTIDLNDYPRSPAAPTANGAR